MHFHRVEVYRHRHVGAYRGQLARHDDVVNGALHLLAQLTFYLTRTREETLYASELAYELGCGLLAHTRATRVVVARVAHQTEQVYHLRCIVQTVLFCHFARPHVLIAPAVTRAEDVNAVCHQLCIVLIRREHENVHSIGGAMMSHGTDDIVGLIAVNLEHGDAIGREDILDDRHGEAYVLGCLFALRLVGGEHLVAERLAVVKGHGDVRGVHLLQYLVEGVAEAHHGTRVEALAVDARGADEGVITAVDDGVGIKED